MRMSKGWTENCIRSHGTMRLLAVFFAFLIAASQCFVLWPALSEGVSAETAGENLSVRIQYFGERGDMIREKASFSRSELEAMGAQTWYYSNVTSVGTVMSMAAYGPEVMTIIEAAGIDPGAILNITFRTTDGYTRNFTVEQHLSGGRLFYPYLSSNYERSDDGKTLIPLEGSLEDAMEVPSILALEFGATKAPGVNAADLSMGKKDTFRFCMGQSPLMEGVQTRPGQDGGDVSSMDSVHSIYGMDVTLSGSPVAGIGIDPVDTELKVGSVTKLQIHVDGDKLFAEDYDKALGKLTWSSSDPSIAKVDSEGNVTILKAGTVTITVTAANGMSASVTINGTGKPEKKNQEPEVTKQTKETKKTAETTTRQAGQERRTTQVSQPEEPSKPKVRLREISLGGKVEEEPPEAAEERAMDESSAALEEQDTHHPGAAAGVSLTAIAACGAGGIHRFRRFREITKGWKR